MEHSTEAVTAMANAASLFYLYYIGLGLAALGAALGLGKAVSSAMEAMGRQPEAIGKIQLSMIIGCAFIEALAIYALISPTFVGSPFEAIMTALSAK